MAEFLVRRGCPDVVTLSVKAPKGVAAVAVKVRSNGTVRKVTIPDALVASIPAHLASQLVRLDQPAPAGVAPESEPPSSGADEQPTMPATPVALAADPPASRRHTREE